MTPEEVAARTAARMGHLKQVLSTEEWAQVVAGSQSDCAHCLHPQAEHHGGDLGSCMDVDPEGYECMCKWFEGPIER